MEEEGEVDEEAQGGGLLKGIDSVIPDPSVVKKNEAEREHFLWRDENDTKENEVFEADMSAMTERDLPRRRRINVSSLNQEPSSLVSTTGRRSCLVSR